MYDKKVQDIFKETCFGNSLTFWSTYFQHFGQNFAVWKLHPAPSLVELEIMPVKNLLLAISN
jgi:hypothetical protein